MAQVTAAEGVRRARFSTAGLPAAERLALWERHNAHALVGLSCKTLDDEPLVATELNLNLPNLHLAQVSGSPHLVDRTAREIDEHPTGSAVLYIALAGEAFFYSTRATRVLRPGEAVLCDADQPFARGFSQGLREFVLKIPHAALEEPAGSGAPRGAEFFDLSDGPAADALRTLTRLVRTSLEAPGDARRTERQALDLLAALRSGRAGGDHLATAQAIIESHLRDPDLRASRIAERIGISERQLCRVFSQEGLSVARYVLDRRLRLAQEMLTSPDAAGCSIAEIARDCGFVSPSHFTRTYKRHYEVTPAQTRSRAGKSG
ncbi:helix-turn-helix domain-containing protein [Saccharopolyspora griseoalba]|uniref:Helix-turn-helix domain-containing protein n=1 Tax=Saccharopolyspora griseoalba TaxID=1431848 RepID=A0ABW2LDF3_9PSEU